VRQVSLSWKCIRLATVRGRITSEPDSEKDPMKRYRYLEIVKLEVMCSDKDLEKFLK